MATQSYSNHVRMVPGFHYGLSGIVLLTLIGSVVNLVQSWGDHERIYSASLIVALTVALIFFWYYIRTFPIKAQDRAIRAEENLRHFVMTGKPLDTRLTLRQIIALRFASDAEFTDLARRAAEGNMAPDAIKRAVKNWRPDNDRV
jgi:hypothetical protein